MILPSFIKPMAFVRNSITVLMVFAEKTYRNNAMISNTIPPKQTPRQRDIFFPALLMISIPKYNKLQTNI